MSKAVTGVKLIAFLIPVIALLTYYNLSMEKKCYEPHIYTINSGRVLVAKITGDPDITLETAQTTLYSAARKLKLSPSYITARHLDWEQRDTVPREQWVVHYSRMVPETATDLADIEDTTYVSIFYDRRETTKIAEILHLGRYEDIPQSLKKLRTYINNEGYRLSGFYEEVYLVFEAIESSPSKYETLLRYQIVRLRAIERFHLVTYSHKRLGRQRCIHLRGAYK